MLSNVTFMSRIKDIIDKINPDSQFKPDTKSVENYEALNNEVFNYGMEALAEAIEEGGGGGGGGTSALTDDEMLALLVETDSIDAVYVMENNERKYLSDENNNILMW